MNLSRIFLIAALGLASCAQPAADDNLTRYVDPRIGTGGHGHVFVGANVPFGFVQLGPTSIPQAWDWTSGYHDSDSTVIGFSASPLRRAASRKPSGLPCAPIRKKRLRFCGTPHRLASSTACVMP